MDFIESAGQWLVEAVRPDAWVGTQKGRQWSSLESPQHTVMTFLGAMSEVRHGKDQAWSRALSALGGSGGKVEARRLEAILLRLADFQSVDLAGPEAVESEQITRYELFPHAIDHAWIWRELDAPPEGEVVLIRSGNGDWVFTPETVAGSERLLASVSALPPEFHAEDSAAAVASLLRPTFEKTAWEGWIAMALIVGAGVFLGLWIKRGLAAAANKLEQHDGGTSATALRSLATPAGLLVAAVGVGLGMGFVHLGSGLNRLRWSIVEILLLVAVGLLAVNLLDLATLAIRRNLDGEDSPLAEMALTALRRAARIAAFAVLTLFIVQNTLNFEITAFLGGIGLVGLALSLAAKDSLKNFFGGLMVFMNRQFVVGDWIRFRKALGQVEDVGMQVTRVRLLTGELWSVPNMHFIDEPVENLYQREYIRREMDVTIPYDLPADKVEEALRICEEVLDEKKIVEEGRFQLDRRPPRISFSHFGDYFLNIRIYYWYFFGDGNEIQRNSERGWFEYLDHCEMVNLRLLERFNEAGIEFAFPTNTTYLANDPNRSIELSPPPREEDAFDANENNGQRRSRGKQPVKVPGGRDESDEGEGEGGQ